MVATANGSFLANSEFAVSGRKPFFWTMVALAALDIVLLFWILNPISKPAVEPRASAVSATQVRAAVDDAQAKRSPLGAVATHVPAKPSGTRTDFVTLAYSGR